jgi:hypothetical protein
MALSNCVVGQTGINFRLAGYVIIKAILSTVGQENRLIVDQLIAI